MAADVRAVRFDRYGGREVLQLAEIPAPEPGPGQVLLEVRASSVNPFDMQLRAGWLHDIFPATFPAEQGSDVAGVVVGLGAGVEHLGIGDEVLGWTMRAGHATHAVVPADQLAAKPQGLSWEAAGSLPTVGFTAYASIQAIAAQPGETVAVSAASGGVGTFLVQLLTGQGVRALAIAGPESADRLAEYGALPVPYGDGLGDRLKTAAGESGIDAFIDLYGAEYLDLALELGVSAERIQTTVAFARAAQIGARTDGRHNAADLKLLTELSELVASGAVEIPIAATYPLERVADAFEQLEQGHARGKIVLIP